VSPARPQTRVPVVVLDVGYGGLAIARSLGRMGISVYGVATDSRAAGLASRYWTRTFGWSFAEHPADRSVDFMQEVGRTIGAQAILMPTSDTTIMFLAEHAETLKERFLFPHQPAALIRSLVNKEQMYRLAERARIATPRTAYPRSRVEVQRFADEATFPVLAKGVDTRLPDGTTKRVFTQREDLFAYFETVADAPEPNVMVQEYIAGDESVWMFDGYVDRRSNWVAAVTGLKLRQHPPYAGVASLGVCRRNDEVEQMSRRFLSFLDYQGPVDIDYTFDRRDGAYKILDVNPRIGGAFRLYVGPDGMDLARAYYLDMTDQPVPPIVPREGRKWMMEEDVTACFRAPLGFRAWARSLGGVQETAWFAVDDPVPFLARCRTALGHLFRARRGRRAPLVELRGIHGTHEQPRTS